MKTFEMICVGLILIFAAGLADAAGPWTEESSDATLDTRLSFCLTADADSSADSRSFDDGWSSEAPLNTWPFRGTVITVR